MNKLFNTKIFTGMALAIAASVNVTTADAAINESIHVASNDTINISGQNSSSSYATYNTPLRIASGKSTTFITSRYTYLNSKVEGLGTLNILSGGERTYIGGSDKKFPDGSAFKGETHVYPYKKLSSSNGFYGLVWMHGGKTFSLDAALTNMNDAKVMDFFRNSTLVLHNGTTLGAESGVHGIRIGKLESEAGSRIIGYVKSKANNDTYYIVGGNNQDSKIAGDIVSSSSDMKLGFIKEGTGTYTLSGTGNDITGGLRVLGGAVMINSNTKASGFYVMKEGTMGGTGTVKGEAQIYGTLEPGNKGVGTLTHAGKLVLRPTARIDFEINGSESFDKVVVQDAVTYYNIGQDFATSEQMPRFCIHVADDANLKEGDQFLLFQAKSKSQYAANMEWAFDFRFPPSYSWEIVESNTADGYKVYAKVTSTIYTGQGNNGYDAIAGQEEDIDYGTWDRSSERRLVIPLRYYADKANMKIGTCVPVWKINVNDASNSRTALIAKQFNMVVCENEMKFDNVEPNQNEFNFGDGDNLVNFATRNKMYVRGHTLAWHSQVPGWLTSDGTKNSYNYTRKQLLDILKNHILKTVGHWKGKVNEWDVANEVLNDNQTKIYSNPDAYDLRPSVWATGIGEDFLDSAFVWAHQADPKAKLILNDYGVEGKGWAKSEALYNLAKRLRKSGIPIDGVGIQCHMDANMTSFAAIDRNIERYKNDNFLCRITELDLGASTDELTTVQPEAYFKFVRLAMKHENCQSLMIWGLSDDLTWRTGRNPLLYDSSLNAKNAYWGAHAGIRMSYEDYLNATSIGEVSVPEPSAEVKGEVFDLFGRKVKAMLPNKIYIVDGKKVIKD